MKFPLVSDRKSFPADSHNFAPVKKISIDSFDHQHGSKPAIDQERGIYYAAFTLSGCLVECFGDTGIIEILGQQVASIQVIRPLKLLDLRGAGAMRSGSIAALAKVADRQLSQAWSRFFYERID